MCFLYLTFQRKSFDIHRWTVVDLKRNVQKKDGFLRIFITWNAAIFGILAIFCILNNFLWFWILKTWKFDSFMLAHVFFQIQKFHTPICWFFYNKFLRVFWIRNRFFIFFFSELRAAKDGKKAWNFSVYCCI